MFPSLAPSQPLEIDVADSATEPARRLVVRLGKPWPDAELVRLLLEKVRSGEDQTFAARILQP